MTAYFISVLISLSIAVLAGCLIWKYRDVNNVKGDIKNITINTFSAMLAFSLALIGLAIQDGFTTRASDEKDRSDFITKTAIYLKDMERSISTMNSSVIKIKNIVDRCNKSKDLEDVDIDSNFYELVEALSDIKSYSAKNAQNIRDIGPVLMKFPDRSVVATYHFATYIDGLVDRISDIKQHLIAFNDQLSFDPKDGFGLNVEKHRIKYIICKNSAQSGGNIISAIQTSGSLLINICVMANIARDNLLGGKADFDLLDMINGRVFDVNVSSKFSTRDGKSCLSYFKEILKL